MNWLATPPSYF